MITAAERPRIEAMWVVHLMLTLAALYAVIIAGMFHACPVDAYTPQG